MTLTLAVELNQIDIVRELIGAGALGVEPWDYIDLYDFAVENNFKEIEKMLYEEGITEGPCDVCKKIHECDNMSCE